MMSEMQITIRTIEEDEQGFIINSARKSSEIISAVGYSNHNTELLDPDKNNILQIAPNESYTCISLYRDICTAIGVEPVFALDSDNPALFNMLIELEDNILIKIEDYHIALNEILEMFNSNLRTVYMQFNLGRGEVYRGDGIRMSMMAESGIRHHGAHVHVEGKDERSATFPIDENGKYKGNLNKREYHTAEKIIRNNKKVLLKIWKALNNEGISVSVDYKLGRIKIRKT